MSSTPLEADKLLRIAELFDLLSTLTKNHQIYGLAHPRTRESMEKYQAHAAMVARIPGVDRRLLIPYHDKRLYLEHVPLPTLGKKGHILLEHLSKNGQGGFELDLNVPEDALEEVLLILGKKPSNRRGAGAKIVAGVPAFSWIDTEKVGQLESSNSTTRQRNHVLLSLTELRIEDELYLTAMGTLASFMDSARDEPEGDMGSMNVVSKKLVDLVVDESEKILPLTTIPYHDNFTYYHSLNVSLLTIKCASLLVTGEDRLRRVGQAGLLHDVGKIDVPEEILYKPGRLTDEEAAVVMIHPVTGARRISQFKDVDPLAAVVAFGHHIKDNGQGYPKVSPSYRLGPVTKILEVCDIFEALTAHRPYKKALSAAQAFEVLYSMPNMSSFRPYMDLLVRAIGFNPVGSRVRTADGEVGIVVSHENNDPRKPVVRVLGKDSEGHANLEEERVLESCGPSQEATIRESTVIAMDPEEDLEVHETTAQA